MDQEQQTDQIPETGVEQPPRRRLPRPGKRAGIISGVLLGLLALGLAGASYAGYDYSKKYEGKILPGASVAGVDVGGMTPEAALEAVRESVRPRLMREITISWGDKSWTVTAKELGAHSNARRSVAAALAVSDEASFMDKTRMRLLGHDLDFTRDVAISFPRRGVRGFIQGLASTINRDPRDAELDYSTGWVKIRKEQEGRSVRVGKSIKALREVLVSGGTQSDLNVKTTQPELTADEYDQVLLVRIGENKLYLYQDGKITHSWTVATGLAEYPTPTGLWEVTELRYMPTWVNPSPDGWGASMPASIPPGPSNPLGLRAINWSAPAIRFHGTTATYSLGYNASHGCVRMSNEDVIELYDMIEVGTPIVSVDTGAYNPLYGSTSIVDAESDAADDSADSEDTKQD
jgi:lipoprotein-anchoring transpeptidase ErfK/SrfK